MSNGAQEKKILEMLLQNIILPPIIKTEAYQPKSPSSLKGCIKLVNEDTVTQSKPNIATATTALTHKIRFRKDSIITTPDSTP